ncbi:hypothetical protein [Planctomicrobium sp. SH664]|uniref:hypothetical protein n=1 Tax=Planctomicrobium sp. SH664 TaxID=3448125 RepID=UPI003F5BD880
MAKIVLTSAQGRENREAIASTSPEHPTSAWVCEQARTFLNEAAGREYEPAIVMPGRDTKLNREFTQTGRSRGLRPNKLPSAVPT